MSVTTAASGLVFLLLTVPGIHSNSGYTVSYTSTEICALRGSTVDITCTYSYPLQVYDASLGINSKTTVQTSFWFVKSSNWVHADLRSDQDYSGRVEYLCGNNRCTLRIRDVRESDSAEYQFRFITNQDKFYGSPGVKVTITDLQVQVSRIKAHNSFIDAELSCQSSCLLPHRLSYIWYKNQHEQEEAQSYSGSFYASDIVSCAVKGHKNVSSPAVSIHNTKGYSVSYTSTEICAVTGSTVDITCTYSYPLQMYYHNVKKYRPTRALESFWFVKDNKDLRSEWDYSGRVEYLHENNKCTLRIKNLRERDSARYKFRFKTNQDGGEFTGKSGVSLRIGDPQLHISVRRSVGQFSNWTELTCQSSCQLPEHQFYVWYNNWREVGEKKNLIIKDFNPSDEYRCSLKERWALRSPSVYAPKPPSVSVNPSGEIVEGSSVTLTCSSDAEPAATYTWYKQSGNTFQPLDGEGTQFVFDSILSSHSGQYQCRAQNELGRNSNNIAIDVKYAPKPPSMSASPSGEIVEGSSVNLTCSTDANPPATYTWYKENEDSVKTTGQIFTITDVGAEHGGNYYCEVQNTRGRRNATLHLSVGRALPTWKAVVIGTTIAIVFAVMLVLVILLIRKKKTSEPGERSDNREQEEQYEPHYASVQFQKNQADPIYARPKKRSNGCNEDTIEYTTVNFGHSVQRPEDQETVEDPAALYSTVKKQ